MKHYLACAAFAAATLVLGACGAQEKETTTETTQTEETVGLKIAYVELDTLMSQYQLYKDYSEVLTRKGNNIQKTLAQKQRALENHAASIQKKYESNEFTTRDELERAQASIQKEQADLAELADRLQSEFAMEQARINDEARDSIQSAANVHYLIKIFSMCRKEPYTPSSKIPLHTVTAISAPNRQPRGTRDKPLNAAWFPT